MISFAVGITFAKSCIEKIITPTEITINLITYIILSVAIVIKLIQTLLYSNFSKAINSDTLKANGRDALFDMLVSIAIVRSMIIMNKFKINIDGYIGLGVSLFIIYSSFSLILETISPLISEKPNKKLIRKIKRELKSFDGINDFHDLIIHSYGSSTIFATVHVEVPITTTLLETHELVDKIERHFEDELNINITIQVDPVDLNNNESNEIEEKIFKTLKKISSKIDIHGLRTVKKGNIIKVLFDIEEPHEKKLNKKEIQQLLINAFINEPEKYVFIFTIDKPYL
jgi:cation diffusion facilitator family transporter